ncbi:MAG: putative Ig domain-containing protein [Acidobacteria bacterium]|nr:putative Ig domain-containing protein [Acidobacteriota bacterium]
MRLDMVAKLVLAGSAFILSAQAQQAIRDLAGFREHSIARNDDGSSSLQQLGFNINFFGRQRSTVYVNNNGNVTFDAALATYTPFGLEGTRREIIAAFFADVDTRGAGSALVTYGNDTINGRRAFGVNYVNVGYFGSHDDKLNRFQLILVERADTGEGNFDIEFNYERIVWETGDASGGAGGYGGIPASVGWSNGTGEPGTSYELDGSLIVGSFLDNGPRSLVRGKLNSTVRGRFLFRARNGYISPGLAITSSCPLPDAAVSAPYAQQMTAVGLTGNPRWSLLPDPGADLPSLSLSREGRLAGSPERTGTYFFTLSLTAQTEDGDQTVTRRCSLAVTPPVLSVAAQSCPLPSGTVGANYSLALRASGGTGGYVWSVGDGLPPGLTLARDGTIGGAPAAAGAFRFTLTAASASGDGAQPGARPCSMTVNPAPLSMAITSLSCELPGATLGVPYAQTLSAAGGTAPYRWSLGGLLPLGLSLSSDGRIAGTPSAEGAYPVAWRVTDAAGRSASRDCWLVVEPPSVRISRACPLPQAFTGVPYQTGLSASGGTGPYTWSAIGSLPPGLTLSSGGRVTGTPTASGPHLFRLLAQDSLGAPAATACSLAVLPAALGISSCPLREGALGQAFEQTLTAAGGVEPLQWSVSGGLTPGLGLSGAGRVAGVPRQAGSFEFAVSVADASGQRATQSCSQRVRPPVVRIATACPLPGARVGTAYTTQLEAGGGAGSFTWSAIGALPRGLTLVPGGVLNGTPELAGNSSFTLRVADSQGGAAVTDCSIDVTLPELPQVRLTELAATIAPATPVTVTVTLSATYSLPILGELELTATPDTGNAALPELNRPDPRVRFASGQRTARFSIPPGAQRAAVQIESSGTVAGTVAVRVTRLEVAGTALRVLPVPRSFQIARLAPVLTDVCFRTSGNGVELAVSGYTTTRQLARADVALGGVSGGFVVDLQGPAWDWFLTDESQRTGGAFTLRAPFEVKGAAASSVSSLTLTVTNAVGTSQSRQASRCP